MKMKKIITVALFVFLLGFVLINQAFSQSLTINEGVIKGKIIDADSENPVEYATIALFKANSDELISGSMSDPKGNFILTNIASGDYQLVADFIGYDKQEIKSIKINNEEKTAVLKIYLNRSVNEIEEVEVYGEKNTVDYKIDRKVINVSKNITATGGSAVDALENVPSVQTDIEGNVTLRGSSDFTVLIDGKPTVLDASDALQQIPASLIENIEIITNPSAKYDPDGTAGIINVITKKTEAKGLTGQINASAGTGLSYTGNIYLKYNSPKFSVSGGLDYSNRLFDMTGETERYTYLGDATESLFTDINGIRNMERFGANLGFDYYLTGNNTISLIGKYRDMNMDRSQTSFNAFQSNTNEIWEYYLTDDINIIKPEFYSFTISDVQKFGKKGHELSASLFYNTHTMNKNESSLQYYSDINKLYGDIYEDGTLLTNNSGEDYKFDLDYILPVRTNGKIEAGFQWNYTMSESDFNSEYLYPDESTDTDADLSTFTRNIYAGYGTYSDKIGKLEFKLGLRTEFTDRTLDQYTLDENYVYQHINLYPSAYVSYSLDNKDQFQINYSKRLNRPRHHFLNPYVMFSDGFTIMQGDPELEPEYAHVAELNYIKKFNNSFLSIETFYRKTNNKMTRLGTLNDEGILVLTMDNLDSDQSAGAEAMLNMQIFKRWTLNLNGSIYQYEVEGDYDDSYTMKKSTNWDSRVVSMLRLGKGTTLQFMAMYRSPSATIEGERAGMLFAGAAVKQDLLKKKLSLSLNVQDIFDSRHREHTTETDSYYIHSEMYRQAPFFNFQISYKINSLKNVNGDKNGETGGYEMYMQ
jgi:hypothetical protein